MFLLAPRGVHRRATQVGRYRREADMNRIYEYAPKLVVYSGLMPVSFTTLAHFSVSARQSLPNSSGLITIIRPPTSVRRALRRASASPALISRLSVAMIAAGVPVGTAMPVQPLTA